MNPRDGGTQAAAPPASGLDRTGERFRRTASRFPTGVTVLSTVVDGQPHGMTVNAFTSVSVDPLMILVSVNHDSRTYRHISSSAVFAVTMLSAGQEGVARAFADPKRPSGARSFVDIPWRAAPYTGCPILPEGVGYFDCVLDRIHPVGDHAVLIGAVRAFDVLTGRPPLLFLHSEFTEPGRPSPKGKQR
ncbi:flavin reductase family protein [Amycolatopsis sp. BJA-103]|uniref:flavin reductase family protein n=1 Tax=Amycolatopsis sp. BJA-103 TaxID=1911175 RepID=UPI001304B7B5|nr:flavin reductase family protein [Amycolatopsis sp. BJA-103]